MAETDLLTMALGSDPLARALDDIGIALWVWDSRTNDLRWTAALEALHGAPRGSSPGGWQAFRSSVHPDDWQRVSEGLQRAAAGGDSVTDRWRIIRPDGSEARVEGRSRPIKDETGRTVGSMGTVSEVMERQPTRGHNRILAEAAQLLSSELDQQHLVRQLVDFLVPRLADWCSVREVDEAGHPMRAVMAHSDPEKVAWAEQLSERYPPKLDADHGMGYVLRTGKPFLIPEITDDVLVNAAVDHEHLSLLRGVGMRSAMLVPALSHGQVMGVLTLIASETDRRYGLEDLELAMKLGGYFGQLLYNARLYRLAEERRLSLEQAQGRWQFILQSAQVGIFEWDIASGEVWWSDTLEASHGLAPGSFEGTIEAFQQYVHPDDLEGLLADVSNSLENGETEFAADYRIIRPDGEVHWLTSQGRIFRKPNGQPSSAMGVCLDITERKRAEEALRESHEWFQAVLQHSYDAIVLIDVSGAITYASPSTLRIFGYTPQELLGRSAFEFIHPDDLPMAQAKLGQVVQKPGSSVQTEVRLQHKNGSVSWIEVSGHNMLDHPQMQGILTNFRDINERKRAEEALREREERYALVIAGAGAAIWDWDVVAKRVLFSPRWKELRGLSDDEVSGYEQEWSGGIHPDDFDRVMAAIQAHFEGRTPIFAEEYRVRHKNGRWIWILDRGIAQRDTEGRVVRMAGSETDITERKHAEESLWKREQEIRSLNAQLERRIGDLETVLKVVPISIVIATDPECRFIKSNPAMAQILGVSTDSNVSLNAPPEEMPEFKFHRNGQEIPPHELPMQVSAARGIALYDVEMDVVREDGKVVNLIGYTAPLLNEDGTVRGSVGAFLDITERKRAEENIRRLNQDLQNLVNKLQTILEVSPVGIGVAEDPECRVIQVNPSFARMVGIPPEVNASKTAVPEQPLAFKIFKNGWEVPGQELPMQVAAAQGVHVSGEELEIVREDGNVVNVLIYATPLLDEDGKPGGSVGAMLDITERKQADEAKARLAAIVESAEDAIISKDLHGVITSWNRGAEQLFGYTAPEAIGQPGTMLTPPERYNEEPGILERIRRGESINHYETVRRRKDGTLLDISLTVSPIIDANGQIVGASKIARDITQSKQAEEALREADRQKDEFLAMLSHELRNPLAPIQHAVNIMQKVGTPDAQLQWAQEVVDRQVAHIKRLLDDLLDISRITQGRITLQHERLEVTRIIDQAVEVSRPVIDDRGHNFTVYAPDRPLYIEGDLTRLAQALSNLLNNAAKYTPEGGRITLTAEAVDQEVVFRIRDTGVGIPPDLLPHVFDALTLGGKVPHGGNGGLGLGLKLVRSLVEMHGGRVEAQSEGQNQGSEFVVWLPGAEEPPQESATGTASTESSQGDEQVQRILIVEDQAVAAVTMAMLLEMEGYEVQTAGDGPSALDISRTFLPQAVVLDIGLPGMDGYELARRLRAQPETQDARLIALSGYGQHQDIQRSRDAGCDDHLVKPVDVEVLLKTLTDTTTR